jgi:hypothetical protein
MAVAVFVPDAIFYTLAIVETKMSPLSASVTSVGPSGSVTISSSRPVSEPGVAGVNFRTDLAVAHVMRMKLPLVADQRSWSMPCGPHPAGHYAIAAPVFVIMVGLPLGITAASTPPA